MWEVRTRKWGKVTPSLRGGNDTLLPRILDSRERQKSDSTKGPSPDRTVKRRIFWRWHWPSNLGTTRQQVLCPTHHAVPERQKEWHTTKVPLLGYKRSPTPRLMTRVMSVLPGSFSFFNVTKGSKYFSKRNTQD